MATRWFFSWMVVSWLATLGLASDIPKNTKLEIRLDQTLSSENADTGERFSATLDKAVSFGNKVVIPKGAKVIGTVYYARSTFNYSQAGELDLQLLSVVCDGKTYSISTNTLFLSGRDPSVDSRAGSRRADATQAAIDVMGAHPTQTIPGTGGTVGVGGARNGVQVFLPAKSKLTFALTSAASD